MAFVPVTIKTEPEDDLNLVCTPDIDFEYSESGMAADGYNQMSAKKIMDMCPKMIGFGMIPPPKRKHKVLTLEDKIELIKKLENGESVASLATFYNVGRATISDIKNKKDSILSFASNLQSYDELKSRKTVRKVKGKSKSKVRTLNVKTSDLQNNKLRTPLPKTSDAQIENSSLRQGNKTNCESSSPLLPTSNAPSESDRFNVQENNNVMTLRSRTFQSSSCNFQQKVNARQPNSSSFQSCDYDSQADNSDLQSVTVGLQPSSSSVQLCSFDIHPNNDSSQSNSFDFEPQIRSLSTRGPQTASGKRKHNVLSIETKIEIIQRLEKGETGVSLAPLYNVGRATISDIKNKRDSILMFAAKLKSEDGLKKRKTMRKANDTSLEDAVYMWYVQKLSQGQNVTGPKLCEKALELNSKLGGTTDFKASTGWLKNFRSRHGIKQLQGELDTFTGDTSGAFTFLHTYLNLLQQEGYQRDDIYSADETIIEWQSMPKNSIVFECDMKEPKSMPQRVTVLLCANASWNHALPLLVIGKPRKEKCFKKVSCLPVTYRSQRNGWMDSEIFMEWYANEFIPAVKKHREFTGKCGKVLLLLDNAPFHPVVDMLNRVDENFKVEFLPCNVTASAHPMDQGAVKKLKIIFRRDVLRRLLLSRNEKESVECVKRLTVKECSHMLADAWNTLSEENMREAWTKLWGIPEEPEAIDVKAYEKDLGEIVEMLHKIPGFSKCSFEDAREWLTIDAGDPGNQILNEDEIVTSVKRDDYDEEADERDSTSDDEQTTVKEGGPTHAEAFNAFEALMGWCEQQRECCPEELLFLKRLRDLAAKKSWIAASAAKRTWITTAVAEYNK